MPTTGTAFYQHPETDEWTPVPTPQRLEDLEYAAILNAMAWADGVQHVAAQALGISPRVLKYKLKHFGLSGARRRTRAA